MKNEFTYISEYINKIDVCCPNCSSKATVSSDSSNRINTRFTCLNCGTSKIWNGNANIYYSSQNHSITEGVLIGFPVDCYFKYPLWFTKQVKNEILFAYNIDHLNFLENYIDDTIRERKQNEYGWSNQSLESRLPKWLLLAKNRDLIIKSISELKQK
ncbi:hypothetical protein [uncultured Aquimarina sp.]|uniref:hypothetical protein n=1 Tax=uncultured Aquimarina sp. TaxID=575652 RepID=UPI00261B569E|nr:hypothetical protein [uncultured Aquimarina sp.]